MDHATGRGVESPVVMAARGRAAESASARPDWADPTGTLMRHTQIDSDSRTHGDTERCGATALVGGVLMSGAEAPRRLDEARGRVDARLGEVRGRLIDRTSTEWSSRSPTSFTGLADASESRRLLNGLPRDTSSWTHRDISRFEEATYRLGRAEMAADGTNLPSGLNGVEMSHLRETVWGGDWHPTTSDGHSVDVNFSGTREGGLNHFILGTDAAVTDARREVVYDPWPSSFGDPFVRGSGAAPRAMGGFEEREAATTTPGIDLDVWREPRVD